MRLIGLAAAFFVLFLALPAYAASLIVYAPQMTIGRSDGAVVLRFPQGLTAVASGEYKVSAGYGRIEVSSAGFAPLELPDEVESASEEAELPRLPRARFSSDNIRSLRFSGRVKLRSEEYAASAGSLASGDGGKTWMLADDVEFVTLGKKERALRGERFSFVREQMVLSTDRAIRVGSATGMGGGATFRSQETVIELRQQRATLSGKAEFSLGDYALQSERMTLDLGAQKLTAEGSPRFVGDGSEVAAEEVTVSFTDEEVTVEATRLSGYLMLRSQAGGA